MSKREILNFNTDWLFKAVDVPGGETKELAVEGFETVHLPHTNIELPHHFFKEEDYQFVSWYRRHFQANKNWHGKRVWLDFNGAMSVAEVYINGHYLGENKGGYVPFSFDITDYLSFTEENLIAVRLDSSKRVDVPPEGDVVDYMLFGGIYRDVYLRILHPVSIVKTFITTPHSSKETACIVMETQVKNRLTVPCRIEMKADIIYKDQLIASMSSEEFTVNAEGIAVIKMETQDLKEPKLWGIDEPNLYKTVLTLFLDGQEVDQYEQVFGIRHIEFKADGLFYLNGQVLKLRGLNRHQMFPYVGQAMGNRMQRRDAEILKYDLGLNFVRTSHYLQAPAFLERCDEIGLLVLEELPGWQHIGDETWQEIAKDHLVKMIERDCNHPSIFLWGVRINESPDHHEFYTQTNELAKKLDPSRPTGGVRNFETSEFLEDVYTYNDFQFNLEGKLTMPTHTPTLVSEYMGHMFPTKRYEHDGRLMQHAEKHAILQNVSYGVKELAGACGWCAFDYNTHVNFGSGDRICYHGVMDIFRIPKYAAYFYQSQRDVKDGITVVIARRLVPAMNEDGGKVITVYSNCEQVEVFVHGESLGRQNPNRILYPNLPHPPFVFNQGLPWPYGAHSEIRAIGYIDGKPVKEHILKMEGEPHHIKLIPDHFELIADGGDMTRILVQTVDQHGQPLSLGHFAVEIEVEGEGQLVGENPLVMEGGQAAVYIRATRTAGVMKFKARNNLFQSAEITINSIPLLEK